MSKNLFVILTIAFYAINFTGCSQAEKKPVHNMSKEDLTKMHKKFFTDLGFSDTAATELCTVVTGFYEKVSQQGEPLERTEHIKFADKEDYMNKHQEWFKMLGISESTRSELKTIQGNIWDKMQRGDNDPLMQELKKMMAKFGGMPPCCSKDSVKRAQQ